MFRTLSAAAALAVFAGPALAISIDFEDQLAGGADSENLGTEEVIAPGVTAYAVNDQYIQYVRVGGSPPDAFVPNDTPVPGDAFGEVFLTGDFSGNTGIKLVFDVALTEITFDIADIDGGSSDNILNQSNDESFTFDFLLGLDLVGSQTVTTNDVTGDGQVTPISFGAGLFDTVLITATTPGGSRNIGWGIDNINATAVPLPAGLLFGLTGLAALGFARSRRTA